MIRSKASMLVSAVLFLTFATLPLHAAGKGGDRDNPHVVIADRSQAPPGLDPFKGVDIHLAAEPLPTDGALVKFIPAGGKILSVRVYSEPSNTLLAVILDKSEEPSFWLEKTFPSTKRPDSFPLTLAAMDEGATVVALAAAPPSTDKRIRTHLRAWFPIEGGAFEQQERLLITLTSPSRFSFNYKRFLEPTLEVDPIVCCGDPGTCGSCTECGGETWTCCLQTDYQCGWCGGNIAYCGDCFCGNC